MVNLPLIINIIYWFIALMNDSPKYNVFFFFCNLLTKVCMDSHLLNKIILHQLGSKLLFKKQNIKK